MQVHKKNNPHIIKFQISKATEGRCHKDEDEEEGEFKKVSINKMANSGNPQQRESNSVYNMHT